ncbi:hypothetical protein MD484_g6597, partial [Candolleomyces efflorescens]
MAPRSWATDDQAAFLRQKEGKFREAQVTRRFEDLWSNLMAEWVCRWPAIESVFPGQNLKVADLDEGQLEIYNKELEKLRTIAGATSKDLRKILASSGGRHFKDYEMYVKVVAEGFDDYHTEAAAKAGLVGRSKIQVWHQNAKAYFQMATDEEHEEVAARMREQEEIKKAAINDEEELTPAQRQHFLDILPSVLSATVDPAVRKAGMMAFVCVVGPVPKEGGKIVATSYQFGDEKSTPLFASSWGQYDQVFTNEFGNFARRHLFSKEVCAQRALPDTKKSEDPGADNTSSPRTDASPPNNANQGSGNAPPCVTPPQMPDNTPEPCVVPQQKEAVSQPVNSASSASRKSGGERKSAEAAILPPTSTPTDGPVSMLGPQLYLPNSLPSNHPDLAIDSPHCSGDYATHLDPTSSLVPNFIDSEAWSSIDISNAPWADPAALEAVACGISPPAAGSFLLSTPSFSKAGDDSGGYPSNLYGVNSNYDTTTHSPTRLHPASFDTSNTNSIPNSFSTSDLPIPHLGNVSASPPTSTLWSNMATFPQDNLASIPPVQTTTSGPASQIQPQSIATPNHPAAGRSQAAAAGDCPTSTTSSDVPTSMGSSSKASGEEAAQPVASAQTPPVQPPPPVHVQSSPSPPEQPPPNSLQPPPVQPPVSPTQIPASVSPLSPEPTSHGAQLPPPPSPPRNHLRSLPPANVDIRRSSRSIVKSTRADQLNAIGTNPTPPPKPTPDFTVPPPWFAQAVTYLSSKSELGPQFLALVEKWQVLEANGGYGYKSSKGLSTKGRPEEWAKFKPAKHTGLRNYASSPPIADPVEFGIAVARWWRDMQPDFRQDSSTDLPLPIYAPDTLSLGDPWQQVRKYGPTGLSCLLTLMSWWGSAILNTSVWFDNPRPLWEGVVDDLDKVFDALVSTPSTLKRARTDDPAQDKENKRPRTS